MRGFDIDGPLELILSQCSSSGVLLTFSQEALFVEHCNSVEEEQSGDVQIAKGEPHLPVCRFFGEKKRDHSSG